ncbi:MAG: SLC13 family permease, partial [Calditrichaeota bacterium]
MQAANFPFFYTLAVLGFMSILLIKEWFETELVIFSALILLILGKVVSVKQAFAGFSNEGMLTIALLFIVAGSLHHSGIIAQVNPWLFGRNHDGIAKKLLRILFPISAISAFMNNTPLVAMLIPAVRTWCEKNRYAPSKFLIPISYAAILGGMCTLIGTSTNLIVHGLMLDHGMKGMSLFEISAVGIPGALAGLLFIIAFGHRLLPERKEPIIELGENTREYVIELKVTPAYQNANKTIEQAGLRHLQGLFLFQIERNGRVIAPAGPNEKILAGDRLFFTGLPKTILELQKTPGLQLIKDSTFDLKQYNSAEIRTYEAVVSPSSPLIGKNVRDSNFRQRYGAVIIAIH